MVSSSETGWVDVGTWAMGLTGVTTGGLFFLPNPEEWRRPRVVFPAWKVLLFDTLGGIVSGRTDWRFLFLPNIFLSPPEAGSFFFSLLPCLALLSGLVAL